MSETIELGEAIGLLQNTGIRKIEGYYRVDQTDYAVTAYKIGDSVIRIDLKKRI